MQTYGLTEATGLSDRLEVHRGSVLDLPFPDAEFDAAYSQNVSMNIADKARFYGEACRVLKPGGVLALSELCIGPEGEVVYPVPWAETAATSFLANADDVTGLLEQAGFEVLGAHDGVDRALAFYAKQRARVARDGPPPLGIHLILGDRFKEMARNSVRNVEERRAIPFDFICRKR